MNVEQMKARIEEIVAELDKFDNIENLETEQVEVINGLHTEFAGLKSKIEAADKMAAMKTVAAESTRKFAPKAAPVKVTPQKPAANKTKAAKPVVSDAGYCYKCGAPLRPDASFCMKCGGKL